MLVEQLLQEAAENDIVVERVEMPQGISGLYGDNLIWINRRISTRRQLACILSEELGHHHTTVGDITDQSKVENRRQERRAREWAYRRLVPLRKLIDAHNERISGQHDLAEYLGVTEEFLQNSIDRYKEKYGVFVVVDERFTIFFDPLAVLEVFEAAE